MHNSVVQALHSLVLSCGHTECPPGDSRWTQGLFQGCPGSLPDGKGNHTWYILIPVHTM